ncbi:peptidoglycan editing factor PgeF [Sneathiella marina]|uniref:Purine nucleoside phosphorylase n=1 Tax=Sneathiella marina TaxID=2950108 RepID=A0ABY4W5S6_9PROT|nr:peptidoglycan editing factor PgeF [Sneathiella marina]USG62362.1 peptidoglycan editing factor PgeF [Sneathiella marina]
MLTSSIFESDNISHGFFTRKGGVSHGIYSSLNCGPGSKDRAEDVFENRARAMRDLGVGPDMLRTIHQVHSADVVVIQDELEMPEKPKADAMVTNVPGLALGILTADCVPILFADTEHQVIGAAHSGWKGALSNIGKNTVEAMIQLGAAKSDIKAAVGPAITQASYEVGPEFPAPFLAVDSQAARYFTPSVNAGHHMFNLKEYVRDRLLETGIDRVDMLENDTCAEEDLFYSYRRMTKRGEADYGRQLSAIALIGNE